VPFFAIASGGNVSGAPSTREQTERDRAATAAAEQVAREHGVRPAQVRLAWTLHKGPNVLAIPGTGNARHLEENVAAGALRLTDDDLARLDTIG
jgi:pyridoxine 4-dehydrogenase